MTSLATPLGPAAPIGGQRLAFAHPTVLGSDLASKTREAGSSELDPNFSVAVLQPGRCSTGQGPNGSLQHGLSARDQLFPIGFQYQTLISQLLDTQTGVFLAGIPLQ